MTGIIGTREEHLAWCKQRALPYVEAGLLTQAVASMLSDLNKWEGGPLYPPAAYNTLAMDGMMFCKAPEQVRDWIKGFN